MSARSTPGELDPAAGDRARHGRGGARPPGRGDRRPAAPGRADRLLRAACRDIARRLEEWQGPGTVIVCGRLCAGCPAGTGPAGGARRHPGSGRRLPPSPHGPTPRSSSSWPPPRRPRAREALERCRCQVRDARRPALRDGGGHPDGAGAGRIDAATTARRSTRAPPRDRPWLAGIERLDDPRGRGASSPRASSTAGCAATCGHRRLLLAAVALLLRVDFVVDGLGRIFRSPRQQDALQRAYAASWFSRFIVTLVIAVVLAGGAGRRGRRHVTRHLAGPRRRRAARAVGRGARGPARSPTPCSTIDGEDALDGPAAAVEAGAVRASSPAVRWSPS